MNDLHAERPPTQHTKRSLLANYARSETSVLYSLLRRGTGDEHTARDLLQDTLADALKALDRFDATRPIGPWMQRIGRNRLLKWLRRKRTEAQLGRPVAVEEVSVDSDPSLPTLDRERTTELDAALSRLRAEDRVLLLLRYTEGLACQSIAAQTGLSPNAVSLRLARARERLRLQLGEGDH